jgi:hypothetical protein
MPFTIKKPHPEHPKAKVWHTWDPDGDGYEEVRKFVTREKAEAFGAKFEGAEVFEVPHEIGQSDKELLEKERLAEDPTTPHGFPGGRETIGALHTFTPEGKLG